MTKHTFLAEPNSLEIVSTYIFDTPRKRVFEAYTDPNLIPKWWGPESEAIKVEKMEVKAGGSWRFIIGSEDQGSAFRFRGVYHGVNAPEKIIATWQYEDAPTVILETITFEELSDNKTKVTDQMVFQSIKDRQMMLDNGMDEGSIPMMKRLAELL